MKITLNASQQLQSYIRALNRNYKNHADILCLQISETPGHENIISNEILKEKRNGMYDLINQGPVNASHLPAVKAIIVSDGGTKRI